MNDILIKLILSAGTLLIMFSIAGFLTWVERKQSAVMQDRIGANRASIFGFKAMGMFHALADVLKMLSKEEFMPEGANKFLFNLAPYLSIIFAPFPKFLAYTSPNLPASRIAFYMRSSSAGHLRHHTTGQVF